MALSHGDVEVRSAFPLYGGFVNDPVRIQIFRGKRKIGRVSGVLPVLVPLSGSTIAYGNTTIAAYIPDRFVQDAREVRRFESAISNRDLLAHSWIDN